MCACVCMCVCVFVYMQVFKHHPNSSSDLLHWFDCLPTCAPLSLWDPSKEENSIKYHYIISFNVNGSHTVPNVKRVTVIRVIYNINYWTNQWTVELIYLCLILPTPVLKTYEIRNHVSMLKFEIVFKEYPLLHKNTLFESLVIM